MISVIGVCETTDEDRIVTTRLAFPETIGLHEDPEALRGVVQHNMLQQLPEGVELRPETLSIVQDRINL
jgi:hypothetical protein